MQLSWGKGDIDMLDANVIEKLNGIANIGRRSIIEMIYYGGSGHPGGSLSCVDILTALYFEIMNINPEYPKMHDRDRFILSKAHSAPALYAVLAERGFFKKELLKRFSHNGSPLQKHIDMRCLAGVEISGGSLGQGLSISVGMALAAKMDKSTRRIYVCLGDGELDEGQNWEAAMTAAHYKLDNITAFVDRNRLQVDGTTDEVMNLEPLSYKWEAFGFNVIEIDGHDMNQILMAVNNAKETKSKPTVIISHTTKGKGISFIENRVKWHAGSFTREQAEMALKELGVKDVIL